MYTHTHTHTSMREKVANCMQGGRCYMYTHTNTHTHTSMREKVGKTIIKFSPFMERRLPLSHGALGGLPSTHVL